MPTPITNVTKTLVYKTPNEWFSLDDSANKTGTVTYTGPDKIWAIVDNDNKKISPPTYTSENDGDSIPVPDGMTRVLLSAESQDDLIIMSIIDHSRITTPVGYTETHATLPNGSTYIVKSVLEIHNCYSLDTITYNFETESWEFSYINPDITWDDLINIRNGALLASDGKISPDMPDSLKQKWIDYRAALRDFPATFGRGTDNEVSPWKVTLPTAPEA